MTVPMIRPHFKLLMKFTLLRNRSDRRTDLRTDHLKPRIWRDGQKSWIHGARIIFGKPTVSVTIGHQVYGIGRYAVLVSFQP